ncbi:MotA/TolQ/ExbB proton channel [Denitrovibrio acetiphilus DSM 12809]|uniref:MotA/TolQ/ExbB proton channel n=1 Tax=Denitrovibrio acetiphilus (strain DSM 12809 / NBRC 114555 / N2460) TaxID=522772 RepID=D4H8M7_DENA2|nr:MotA/TolQ/ExbB proton channel family protein [Denitrovibrio acetiphilus]ADD68376.1 MotA/TolQ/ExbB proton channel [Denitrovibrio acetiphilus DSM 12809]
MLSETFENTIQHFQSGGIVMPALLISSLFMWLLIFMKAFQFVQIRKSEVSFEECMEGFRAGTHVGAAWQKDVMQFARESIFLSGKYRNRMLNSYLSTVTSGISQHVNTVLILASAAPLFGLFGTVSGMIDTFNVISYYGTGNPRAMASGISVALVTTQAGLVVAVPGLVMGSFLRRRASVTQDRIHLFGHMLIKELEK